MAPQRAPTHRAQTIKQAKAAYKSRNHSTLTERERKQLERSIELDRRAWKAREAEKRRAEAKAKREVKERREREAELGVTGQRRRDRFGFVGSQMHLGAFFGGGGIGDGRDLRVPDGGRGCAAEEEEECFDEDLDDESMLDLLDSTDASHTAAKEATGRTTPQKHMPAGSGQDMVRTDTPIAQMADLDDLWTDLDSSTQIARDLDSGPVIQANKTKSFSISFGSEDFDLSVEDIEEVQTNESTRTKLDQDKKLMPPPSLLVEPRPPAKPSFIAGRTEQALLLPLQPAPPRATRLPAALPKSATQTTSCTPKPKASHTGNAGYTLAELESFIEDDLQLTQLDPV